MKTYLLSFLNNINLNEIFYDKNNYFAHRDAQNNSFKETLYEHSINTLIVSDYFLKKNNYKIIQEITNTFYDNIKVYEYIKNSNIDKEKIFIYFLETFYLTVLYHDYGKHNPYFQKNKMDNPITNDIYIKDFNIQENDNTHSNYSNILNVLNSYNFIDEAFIIEKKYFNKDIKEPYLKILEFIIKKHHSGLDTINNNELDSIKQMNDLFNFELNIIIDLLYSILVQSDMLSTTYYMIIQEDKLNYNNMIEIINTLESYLNNKLAKIDKNEIKTIEEKKAYNNFLYKNVRFFNELEINKTNKLNDLKYKVSSNIVFSKNVGDIRIFNGNTGIGKTNISMVYINELIKQYDISKVIYSLPLNILINQTYEELIDTFNFKNNKINIINSENGIKNNDKEDKKINYWNLKYDFENFNNEIVLTSTINFFHKLFHKDKKSKLSLINLQDSLLILDEIQLIDDRYFELVYKYILMLNKYLNVKVLILSATLPIPPKFNKEFKDKLILEENLNKAILEHNLFKRTNYNFDYFNNSNAKNISDYINNSTTEFNFLIVHNSIKKCNELYNGMSLNKEIEVYFYNNTLIKPILSSILDKVRNNSTTQSEQALLVRKKIVVISTMKIETGVDISFDCGFKFSSNIDSLQQFAGRINRYGNRDISKVFILKDYIKIFGQNQQRDIIAKNNCMDKEHFQKYLKNIDKYYKTLFNTIQSKSNKLIYFDQLNFNELNKIKLIDNNYLLTSFFVRVQDVSLFLNEKDLNLYKKYFNSLDNEILLKEYIKTFFYIQEDIKYLFSLFNFRGYINFKSMFYKNLGEPKIIENNKTKDIIEHYYLINDNCFYYDLFKGLDTNKEEVDIEDIEDLINSI